MAELDKTISVIESWLKQPVLTPPPINELYDALELLKEQEAKKVTWRVGRAHCPSCGELFPKKQDKQYIRFCNYCGQAVKWDD